MDNGWEDLGEEENKKRSKRETIWLWGLFVIYVISAVTMFLIYFLQ